MVKKLKPKAIELKVFAQAFDPEIILNERQLLVAYALAKKAFENKENKSTSLENETLAKVAATAKLAEAIKIAGAKDAKDFLLMTDANDATLDKLLASIQAKKTEANFSPNKKKLANVFGITKTLLENYSEEEIILEKMALSGTD